MLPNLNQQGAGGAGLNVRPVEALKPSFSLSFDNSPTELSTWLAQFKSYFEASRLHTLPLDQQQAFLRQGLAPGSSALATSWNKLEEQRRTARA